MEVVISGNLVTITKADGTETTLNGPQFTSDSDTKAVQYNTEPVVQGSDPYTIPNPTSVVRYKIFIHMSDGRVEWFFLDEVTNQGTWTNDLTGANIAVDDIAQAMIISGGGGGGSVNSVTGSAPIASSGGANPAISLNNSGVTAGAYTVNGQALFTVTAKGLISTAVSAALTSDDIPDQSGIGFTVTDALLNLQSQIVPSVTTVNGIGPGDITVDAEDIDVIDMVVVTMGTLNNVLFLDGFSSDPNTFIGNVGGNWVIYVGASPTYYSGTPATSPITSATAWTDGAFGPPIQFVVQAYEGTVQDALQAAASNIGALSTYKMVEGTVVGSALTVVGGSLGATLTADNIATGVYHIDGPSGIFPTGKTVLIPVVVDANPYYCTIDYASDSRSVVNVFDSTGTAADPTMIQFTIRTYA